MKVIKTIYIKRWFDKINGNSYYNFYWLNTKGERVNSLCDTNYGYWNVVTYWSTVDQLAKQWYKLSKKLEVVDLDYWLKREMKSL